MVTDEELLSFIVREDRPIQTAQSVGDQFSIDRSQAYRRLQRLADDGVLERSKVGGKAIVWWLSTESERASDVLICDVNPDDPMFDREIFEAGDPTTTSESIDDILYGDAGSA